MGVSPLSVTPKLMVTLYAIVFKEGNISPKSRFTINSLGESNVPQLDHHVRPHFRELLSTICLIVDKFGVGKEECQSIGEAVDVGDVLGIHVVRIRLRPSSCAAVDKGSFS